MASRSGPRLILTAVCSSTRRCSLEPVPRVYLDRTRHNSTTACPAAPAAPASSSNCATEATGFLVPVSCIPVGDGLHLKWVIAIYKDRVRLSPSSPLDHYWDYQPRGEPNIWLPSAPDLY
ncbi:hypothetical protein BDV25DRAFT_142029 [Aspergillus avenaceus]|uniref:Uncharacterized protein n=1 Tax=Aspergillus avenaceus TaxID=36643 RepID=A0A5N6TPE5_ASPAV|nr:hypothetical protein BDV25DRAFT_142029 [Aspergillus avenaceus]